MLIKTLPVGQLETNCYIVTDEATLECAIIDPGAESNTILDYIEAHNLTPRVVFLTHGHFDHIMAVPEVCEQAQIGAYITRRDAEDANERDKKRIQSVPLTYYSEGDEIPVGSLTFRVLEVPGHTMGSVTLQCERALFVGDTLFSGSCGRTDLGGSMDAMQASLRRLSALEGDWEVYPGHAESTTMEKERAYNYYVKHANSEFPNQ